MVLRIITAHDADDLGDPNRRLRSDHFIHLPGDRSRRSTVYLFSILKDAGLPTPRPRPRPKHPTHQAIRTMSLHDQHAAITESDHVAKFAMTCPRLQPWEAIAVIVLVGFAWVLLPWIDTARERPVFFSNYRTDKQCNEDYWKMSLLFRHAHQRADTVVFGDSVIWGEYVGADQTLTAWLNRGRSDRQYVNAGVNGLHPLAIEGLVRNYARKLSNTQIILHCNLLWLTSIDRDLSSPESLSFNHPRLVPQLLRSIPAYRADCAERLSVVVERSLPFRQWVRHQWIQYFDGSDLPRWSLEHPYAWPLAGRSVSVSDRDSPFAAAVPWTDRGIGQQDYEWVSLDDSLQWQAFVRTIRLLQKRDNRVIVLIGPFNAHILDASGYDQWSAASYCHQRLVAREFG